MTLVKLTTLALHTNFKHSSLKKLIAHDLLYLDSYTFAALLQTCTALEVIDLSYNGAYLRQLITEDFLPDHTSLKKLIAYETDLTEEDVLLLYKKYPGLEIEGVENSKLSSAFQSLSLE